MSIQQLTVWAPGYHFINQSTSNWEIATTSQWPSLSSSGSKFCGAAPPHPPPYILHCSLSWPHVPKSCCSLTSPLGARNQTGIRRKDDLICSFPTLPFSFSCNSLYTWRNIFLKKQVFAFYPQCLSTLWAKCLLQRKWGALMGLLKFKPSQTGLKVTQCESFRCSVRCWTGICGGKRREQNTEK